MTHDNRALWELLKLWTNRVVSDDEMEYKNGFYAAQDKCREELAALLERPVVVGDGPNVTHTVEEVMEFADLLDKHYGAFMQKPIQMLLNYAALIGTQDMTHPNESMVRGKS